MGSCYFCDSCSHKSNECKKYPTIRTRKMIADKKKFCRFCFIKYDKIHLKNKKKCPTNDKCVGWYSTDHHAVFCSERVKGMARNLFLPKIDQDLLQRFIETFDIEEHFAFGLSSQDAQKYVSLKNIKLTNSFSDGNEDIKKLLTSDDIIVVICTLGIYSTNKKEIVFKEITSKKAFWKVRILHIGTLDLSVHELSQLIGSYTKKKKKLNAPNIEILTVFDKSWISKQATWLEDLYKYKEGKNFRELLIHLNNIEFDAETLKKFVETKSINEVIIRFRYENRKKQKVFHRFVDKMSEVFIRKYDEFSHIRLEFEGIRDYKSFYFKHEKNEGPLLKKRQKRNK